MVEPGMVQPSSSPWASPIVLVPNKDGKILFCLDNRKLNEVTTKCISFASDDDARDALTSSTYYCTIDFSAGYW